MPCPDVGQGTVYLVTPVDSLFFRISRYHMPTNKQISIKLKSLENLLLYELSVHHISQLCSTESI